MISSRITRRRLDMLNVFPGILYVVDNIDNIAGAISANPYGRHAVLNLSEDISSTQIGEVFKDITQDATILCPPPIATYMEIDGNTEGFKQCYAEYLFNDEVKRFLLLVLYAVHNGVNVYMYIPEFTNESIWIGLLLNHLKVEYGIDVGLVGKKFMYDIRLADKVLMELYLGNFINPFEYISYLGGFDYMYPEVVARLSMDLARFGCGTNDVISFITDCKAQQNYVYAKYGVAGPAILRPVIVFE
jgi:hypothetical protein